MRATLATLFLTFLAAPAFADNTPIGFHNTTLADPQNKRPLQMVVWYPAATTATPELIRDDAVFFGALAVPDAPPANGNHPLVVISHGNGGNWGNQVWLASALAHRGYIVAAVNHPGTTSKDRSPEAAAQLWQRPKDLSRAIDAVLAQPQQFGAVATGKIAAVGHSLGGWTVLEVGGARFDPVLFAKDCRIHSQLSGCKAYEHCAEDAEIWLAPAYDLVTTTVYRSNDILGLLLGGSKAWPKRQLLAQFGRSSCNLTEARCNELLARVHGGMNRALQELSEYQSTHSAFESVGEKMKAAWAAGLARSITPQ